MHIGQSKITARVAIRQLRMIHPQQMPNRRMEIMEINLASRHLHAVLATFPIGDSALHSSPANHDENTGA